MKLILIHRHFWPSDLPYSQMLGDFALHAKARGIDVAVIAPCESDSDRQKRVQWADKHGVEAHSIVMPSSQGKSIFRKGVSHLQYLVWMSVQLVRVPGDVVWIATTPPIIAAAIVRWVCKFKPMKYVYHCQDIHPEASRAIGKVSNSLLYRAFVHIDKNNVNGATATVVLSNDMQSLLASRGSSTDYIHVVNNFVRHDLVKRSSTDVNATNFPKTIDNPNGKARWIFAGTMGHFQNLKLFVEAFLSLDVDSRPHLTFLGGGVLKSKLMSVVQQSEAEDVIFLDPVDSSTAQTMLQSFDVGIVSLAPDVIRSAYPSKMVNYLAAGLRIFAVLENDSELCGLLRQYDVGDLGHPFDSSLLANDIQQATNRSTQAQDRKRSVDVARQQFDANSVLDRYTDILDGGLDS